MSAISLFLHSTGTGPFLWDAVPDEVVRGTRKLAPANLGYAPEAPIQRGARVTAKDDARHALAALPADTTAVDVFAHSYGAVVAIELVPLLAARLRSLFLVEPVLFGALANATDVPPEARADASSMIDHPWFLNDEERAGSDEWLELFIDYWNRPGAWARLAPAMQEHSRSVAWKMVQEVRSCFHDFTSFDDVKLPPVPTTFALGERSTASSRAMTHALTARYPEAGLIHLEKTGHMSPLTHPARVAEAMLAHRAKVR